MTLEGRIRSVLLLQPRDNDYEALVALFKQHDILGLAMREAGCLNAELQVPLNRSGPIIVTATWESAESYSAWRSHPVRGRFSGDTERLTEPAPEPTAGGVYTIAAAVG
jgi:quinol monooxygenase YgiN